jgi:hypothetical protein
MQALNISSESKDEDFLSPSSKSDSSAEEREKEREREGEREREKEKERERERERFTSQLKAIAGACNDALFLTGGDSMLEDLNCQIFKSPQTAAQSYGDPCNALKGMHTEAQLDVPNFISTLARHFHADSGNVYAACHFIETTSDHFIKVIETLVCGVAARAERRMKEKSFQLFLKQIINVYRCHPGHLNAASMAPDAIVYLKTKIQEVLRCNARAKLLNDLFDPEQNVSWLDRRAAVAYPMKQLLTFYWLCSTNLRSGQPPDKHTLGDLRWLVVCEKQVELEALRNSLRRHAKDAFAAKEKRKKKKQTENERVVETERKKTARREARNQEKDEQDYQSYAAERWPGSFCLCFGHFSDCTKALSATFNITIQSKGLTTNK